MCVCVCVSIWCILVHSIDVCEFPLYAVLGTMKRKSPCPCTSSGGQRINKQTTCQTMVSTIEKNKSGTQEVLGVGIFFLSLNHVL